METINNLILLSIAITALINLIIEIEDTRTFKYEWILRLCFGGVIVGSISSIFYKHPMSSTVLYVALLTALINRILIRKK